MTKKQKVAGAIAAVLLSASVYGLAGAASSISPLSPASLAVSQDGKTLFVACKTANRISLFDTASRKVKGSIPVPGTPAGLTLSNDGARLYVACAATASQIAVIDTEKNRVIDTLPAGHTATSPVLSPDGKSLFVCNRFNNDVAMFDLASKKQLARVKVRREPAFAAVTNDGKFLLVANHLHDGRADADVVSAVVSVINIAQREVVKELELPNGSGALQEIRVSPDGKYAVVSHVIGHYQMPTSQLERGWMNTNAISIIDLVKMQVVNSVLLDSVANGAANPWGLAWTPDGKTIAAAHAGVHEVSLIDFPGVLARIAQVPATPDVKEPVVIATSQVQADIPSDLAFLVGLRQLVKLPEIDRGPRGIAIAGTKLYTANYFSDTLSVIDLAAPVQRAESIALGPKQAVSQVRKGEAWFNDASLCFQGWQSCSSCHPSDARTDALNWDLLNDGLGNPKNSKSMLYAHRTPPAMSMGVRDTAETAVRSGIIHILFTEQPEEVPNAIDAYLKTLRPLPSPHLVNGQLSKAALRGREVFNNPVVACAKCHPSGTLFTNLKQYEVGTSGRFDKGGELFDTPTLVECWRTGPYLHDGSAANMMDVLTKKNATDKHGKTSHLTKQQLEDLAEYVLSL